MARKRMTKKQKGEKLAKEIEALGEKYLKRHRKLASMLKRQYVRSYELYEEPKEDVERVIKLMAQRLRMGKGLPKTRTTLIKRLKKMTRTSIASLKREVVLEQKQDYINALRQLGEDENVIQEFSKRLDEIGWNKFLKSKYYIPLNNFGSPRLQRYIMQFKESPIMTRMKEFIDQNEEIAQAETLDEMEE